MRAGGSGLALRRIDGNVTSTRTGRASWYSLPPQPWSFRSESERESFLTASATCWAGLVGHSFHLRVTTRPYPVEAWAQDVTAAFPDALPSFAPHVVAEHDALFGNSLADQETYLGVNLNVPRLKRGKAVEERNLIGGVIAGRGMEGRPVTDSEIEWLMHRSVSLGAPAPLTLPPPQPVWELEDMAAFTDAANWDCQPYGRASVLTADVNGHVYRRHVVVLTLGRMQDLRIPGEMGPWMQRAAKLGPVEWSIRGKVLPTNEVQRWLRHQSDKIRAQLEHIAEHPGEKPKAALLRQSVRAREVDDEITSGGPLSTRVNCWVRCAVSGDSEQAAVDRAEELIAEYAPKLTWHRKHDQFWKVKSFRPGEADVAGHMRRMPVTTFAAAGAAVTAVVGNKTGFPIGETSSGRGVLWHPWWSMEQEEGPGTTLVSGRKGAGKSNFLGTIGDWAVDGGIRTILFDPPGPLARGLCGQPKWAGLALVTDLMDAPPGSFSPFGLLADPRREDHLAEFVDGMTDDQWRDECEVAWRRAARRAEATRRMWCADTFQSVLPHDLHGHNDTPGVLRDAVRGFSARSTNPRLVLAELTKMGGHGKRVAGALHDLAELPEVALIFPETDEPVPPVYREDLLLQGFTMRNNTVPEPGVPRREWSVQETVGLPLMALGVHAATQAIYSKPRDERAMLMVDEVRQLLRVPTGEALIRRLAEDDRKLDTRMILAMHDMAPVLKLGIAVHLDGGFAFDTEGDDAQGAALEALHIPRKVGFEQHLSTLAPRDRNEDWRDCIMNDGHGGIERVRIRRPEHLRTALDTTPTQSRWRPLELIKQHAVGE